MKISNLILVFFLSLLLFSCTRSLPPLSIEILLSQEVFQGTIWWDLEIKKDFTPSKNTGQAEFQISENFIYVRLKTPIGTTLGLLVWKKDDPGLIKVYDLYNQELVLLFINNPSLLQKLETLPFYFLGMKEETLSWSLDKVFVKYQFDKERKVGTILTEEVIFGWKIQSLEPLRGKTWEAFFDLETLEKQLVKRSIFL